MPNFASLLSVLIACAFSVAACGPKQVYTDSDIPKLEKLEDVMWSQSQVMDPQFKKIGASAYTDDEYSAFSAAAARLKLTTQKIKVSFSKGAEWTQFADELAAHAAELDAAVVSKDAAKASAALQSAKDTCKACHKKFR